MRSAGNFPNRSTGVAPMLSKRASEAPLRARPLSLWIACYNSGARYLAFGLESRQRNGYAPRTAKAGKPL
jgi:hypothetical protein